MFEGHEDLLKLLKNEVGVDELPDDFVSKVEDEWPEIPDKEDLFTQDDVDDIVERRLAREQKAHESEVDELNEKLKKRVPESEKEEAEKEIAEIREQAQERDADRTKDYELKLAAAKAGVRKDAIDDFAKLVDKEELEYDDGEVKGIEDLIERVKDEKQFLFEPEEETSSGGSDFGGEGDETDFFSKEQVKGMSQDEVDENLDKIEKSMSKWNT